MKPSQKSLHEIFGKIPESKWIAEATKMAENKAWLQNSRKVALEILECLDQKKMSQKALAETIGVSPQIVNVWLKGKENFTFETISKLEKALGIVLISIESPSQQSKKQNTGAPISFHEEYDALAFPGKSKNKTVAREAKVIKMQPELLSKYSIAQ